MSLEFENSTTVIGKFGDVCQGPNLDWRHKCKDEIIAATPMVLTDVFWKNLPYQAIVQDTTSINFREPSVCADEGGTSCSPSTANSSTTICDFVLPNLSFVSIGTDSLCYTAWRDRFCEKFPTFRSFSPFVQRGNRIIFRTGDNSPGMLTFAGEVAGELSKAIWDHLYRTFWLGLAANVDEFDGFLKIFDDGISTQGTCDEYPLVPTCVDMALYILGAAAVAAGGTVAPGDVVLAVGDPARPVDAPVDNVISIYPGTLFETSLDITGFDTVDLLTAWYELVVNEWQIDVITWMLGVGKNKTRCLAEVAACKQACSGGDCRQLLVSDARDNQRAARESDFIKSKAIELYPYDVRISMLQSPALAQLNKIIFMPWQFRTGEGITNSLLWVWRDQRSSDAGLFRDVPQLVMDEITYGPLKTTDLHNGEEFRSVARAFESRAFAWLSAQDDNCFKWWNNMEMALIPQAPHLWLCIDNVDCQSVITLPCLNPGLQVQIDSCAATTPNLVYDFTFENPYLLPLTVGDQVTVTSATGVTSLVGSITVVTTVGTTADIEVTLDAAGPFADCIWDGANLDAGGNLLIIN